jgi:hypothetical protein
MRTIAVAVFDAMKVRVSNLLRSRNPLKMALRWGDETAGPVVTTCGPKHNTMGAPEIRPEE